MIANRIFILTGAGVSAESGLSTFRDKSGIWAQYDLEEVASIQEYERNPTKVLEFYNMRRNTHGGIAPNVAHIALAQLQAAWAERGGTVTICTQNVVAIGTSGNLEPSESAHAFDVGRYGKASEQTPAWVAEMIAPAG